MALHRAKQMGYRVRCLVTFAPPKAKFLAHPLAFIKLQARAMGVRHLVLVVEPPFEMGYEAGLRRLHDEEGIGTIVTGDIADVGERPNWLRERGGNVGLDVLTPLWGRRREDLLQDLIELGFKGIISCVKRPWLDDGWVGRKLDRGAIVDLAEKHDCNGMDLCGEQGEYHTLITGGPQFAQEVHVGSYSIRSAGALAYMDSRDLALLGRGTVDLPRRPRSGLSKTAIRH